MIELASLAIAVVGISVALVIRYNRRSRRVTDEDLRKWHEYLSKPARGHSKSLRATTASLGEDEYNQIKQLYPPKLLAEWEEKFGRLRNEFALQAIESEIENRRQMAIEPKHSKALSIAPPLGEGK